MDAVLITQGTVGASRPTEARMERHALILAERGVMRLQADGQRWSLIPGQAALVTADHPVWVSVPGRLSAVWLHMSTGLLAPPPRPLAVFDLSPLASELVKALRLGALTPGATVRMVQTLGDVAFALAEAPSPAVVPSPTSPGLTAALALAEGQLETLPAFGEIAKETGHSSRSLTRRCTEELGMSWRDVIRRLRMVRAVEALATTEAPIAEIAVLVGYNGLSGFNEAFRDVIGESPSEFRARQRDRVAALLSVPDAG